MAIDLKNHNRISLLVPLLLQSALFAYKILIEREYCHNAFYTDCVATVASDTASYIEPVEEWFRSGIYTSQRYGDYRMPGYGIVYGLCRLFFDRPGALNALIVLQLICSIAATSLLPRIAIKLSHSTRAFFITLILCNLAVCSALFNHVLLTESLTVSCTVWILWRQIDRKNPLFSGALLAWLIFIKPFMICIAPILFLHSLLRHDDIQTIEKPQRRNNLIFHLHHLRKNLKTTIYFFIPLFFASTLWTARNYSVHHELRPFNNGVYYPEIEASGVDAIFQWVAAFGGSAQWWKPESAISAVYYRSDSVHVHLDHPLPLRAFTSEYTPDSLRKLQLLADRISLQHPDANTAFEIRRLCGNWKKSLFKEKPLLVLIGARALILKNYILQSGTDKLFNQKFKELNWVKIIIKIICSLDFVLALILGLVGSFYFLFHGFGGKMSWIALSACVLVFGIPLFFGADEHRYLVPSLPFLFILAGILPYYKGEMR